MVAHWENNEALYLNTCLRLEAGGGILSSNGNNGIIPQKLILNSEDFR